MLRELKYSISLLLLVLHSILKPTIAQDRQLGICPLFGGVDIDRDQIMGDWYEFARSPRDAEDYGKCILFQLHQPVMDKWPVSRLMVWEPYGFKTNFTTMSDIKNNKREEQWQGYQVTWIAIDYDKYAVALGCKNGFLLSKREIIWVLTRDQYPSGDVVFKALKAAEDFGLDINELNLVEQDDCPTIAEWEQCVS